MTPCRLAIPLGALAAALPFLASAAEPLAPPGTPAERFPKPDRPVAEIVSPRWAPQARRDRADEVGQVVRLMGIRSGQTVADIGAGSGTYAFPLAKVVGPTGRVIAEDITPDYLADLERTVADARASAIVVARGQAHDPRLPAASLDAAVLAHMYHEIAQPYGLLYNLAAAMKPGARVGIVDSDASPAEHGTPPKLLACELAAIGYKPVGRTVLKGGAGYLALFEAPAPEARPDPATITPCRDETARPGPRRRKAHGRG